MQHGVRVGRQKGFNSAMPQRLAICTRIVLTVVACKSDISSIYFAHLSRMGKVCEMAKAYLLRAQPRFDGRHHALPYSTYRDAINSPPLQVKTRLHALQVETRKSKKSAWSECPQADVWKCNLHAPCSNCERRREKCSLRPEVTTSFDTGLHRAPFFPAPELRVPDHLAFLSLFDPALTEQPAPKPLAWTEDLFLMSHFTSSTSYTLSHREADQHLWRVIVPEMATAHQFLMHGLLAVSAMHLSYVRPQDRSKYEMQSSYHQALATSQLRVVLTNITTENCSAAFGLCALLTLISMVSIARRSDAERDRSGTSFVDDIVHHFMLTRGIGGVLADHWPTILAGPLKILSTDKLDDPDAYALPPDMAQQFSHLRTTVIPALNPSDQEARQMFIVALDGLELVYKNCLFLHPHLPRSKLEVGIALRWMSLVPVEFMTSLTERDHTALLLLAHFVALFTYLGDMWFLQGWCEHAMARIESIMGEDGSVRLEWPIEQLRKRNAQRAG